MASRPDHHTSNSRSEASNRAYCKRLVELAFPDAAIVRGERYGRDELRALLEARPELLSEAGRRYRHLDNEWTVDQLVDAAFPASVRLGTAHYTRQQLIERLPHNPKLQKLVAVKVHFTPSKWLLEQELAARRAWPGEPGDDVYTTAAKKGLLGVCFSGGGIRSATFNLGVLQGLAQIGLLPHIDYLSSVSGGGYIHEFLASWIMRNADGRDGVIAELIPQAEPGCLPRSPEPIKWLMRYASYLTPARGALSTDTWTMIAIWLRNTILNQIPIVMGLASACFAVHLLAGAPAWAKSDYWTWKGDVAATLRWWGAVAGVVMAGIAIWSLVRLGTNLQLQRRMHANSDDSASMKADKLLTNRQVQLKIILPWLAFSGWLSYWVQLRKASDPVVCWLGEAGFALWVLAVAMVVIFAGGAMDSLKRIYEHASKRFYFVCGMAFVCAGIAMTATACALGWGFIEGSGWAARHISCAIGVLGAHNQAASQALKSCVCNSSQANLSGVLSCANAANNGSNGAMIDPWRIQLAILPGLLLGVPYIAIELTMGLLGRSFSDLRREWLARLRAWSMLYGLLWFGLVSLALIGPYLGYWLYGVGPAAVISTAITFLVAHGTTIFAGASGKSDGKPTDNHFLGFKPLDLIAFIAAPLSMLIILLCVSNVASLGLDGLYQAVNGLPDDALPRWAGFVAQYWFVDVACCFVTFAIAVIFGWRVDVNEFSMQSFYRNRLSRCYLAATAPEREADPFSGFDTRAKLWVPDRAGQSLQQKSTQRVQPRVRDLLPKEYRSIHNEQGEYEGPFPIFCTTINLTTGEDLATQERKGASFAFTPLYSGYSIPWTDAKESNRKGCMVSYNGFVPTEEYAYSEGGIGLDTAVAISGAAANPNMGYNSNPAMAFLMTFFNVRLGWWISNPRRESRWLAGRNRPTPYFAALYLFRELFGAVNDAAPYVNLSDGGHFENMGLYELVRRRCRYIVVCDAEEDCGMKFEGIGAAITKCRSDFGVEIDLDLRPLQIEEKTGTSSAHCVVGTITYPPPPGVAREADVSTSCECMGSDDADPYEGVIVYMKTSLVGDEPPDLLTYKLKHPVFPQDSTANQWFLETQFEAYRRLGHHVAMTTMMPAMSPEKVKLDAPATPRGGATDEIRRLFDRMYDIWYPRTPEMEKFLADHMRLYEGILKDLRERKELVGLEAALNQPTLTADEVEWNVPESDEAQVTLYPEQFANSMLDFMYTVYTDLKLAFPDNRISPHSEWWICTFRRWCRVTLVRQTWRKHVVGYPMEFRLFARRELGLPPVAGFVE
ncbi:hypothetical protein ACFPT7_18330 [Acidicapsa dinghuensis]|uniref:PNPLA domain-containing protein n=1 Tax=Acidicapsa dinghuensis TaxID=2218256 RepID=A0ABW1EK01_9BACT|nr:hypothetical protein [Acidicapsa dinghuensis]